MRNGLCERHVGIRPWTSEEISEIYNGWKGIDFEPLKHALQEMFEAYKGGLQEAMREVEKRKWGNWVAWYMREEANHETNIVGRSMLEEQRRRASAWTLLQEDPNALWEDAVMNVWKEEMRDMAFVSEAGKRKAEQSEGGILKRQKHCQEQIISELQT